MAYDRNKDPQNSEELMISEYYRRVEEVNELRKTIKDIRNIADANYAELEDELETAYTEITHLNSILAHEEGVVDMLEPILLYKSSIASEYYFRDWLNDHADDEGENEGLSAYIDALNANDADCIKWFKEHSNRSYTKLVTTSQHTFRYTLKVPGFDILAYDPEYNKTQLIVLEEVYADDRWVNMPLEKFTKCVAAKIREAANIAYRKYKEEQSKKTSEAEEE